MFRGILLAASLLLVGCAQTQPQPPSGLSFIGFHGLLRQNAIKEAETAHMSPDLVNSYSQCWADAKVARLEPEELKKLDGYVAGKIQMDRTELQQIDSETYKRAGTTDKWEFMRPYCPGVVAQLH